jgi:hypothetical protein
MVSKKTTFHDLACLHADSAPFWKLAMAEQQLSFATGTIFLRFG